MLSTISSRMSVVLIAFAALLGAGAVASQYVLKRQAHDAFVVNLAGRQRMLTQKMSKEGAELSLLRARPEPDEASVANLREQLQNTMRVFEMTLFALRDGGPAPQNLELTRLRELPRASNSAIRAQLDRVVAVWHPFKRNLNALLRSGGSDANAMRAVFEGNLMLLEQMNVAVTLMQQDSEARVDQLLLVQIILLGVGLLLVLSGILVARTSIARPLRELADAARSMSTGNLNVELRPQGAREVRELSASFDRMRVSMLAALSAPFGAAALDDDL
ncbi:MAG: type IV pili methyl-accepting chemotaxis transducer N-terminal domain-containing protein [Myxococcota bacterium]